MSGPIQIKMSELWFVAIIITIMAMSLADAFAHSGGTDSLGCHSGSQPYHCHTPKNNFQVTPKNNFNATPQIQGFPQPYDPSALVSQAYFRVNGVGIICPQFNRIKNIADTKIILLSEDRTEAGIAQLNGEEIVYLKTNTMVSPTFISFTSMNMLQHWLLDRRTAHLTVRVGIGSTGSQTLQCSVHTVDDAHQRATNLLNQLKQERKF